MLLLLTPSNSTFLLIPPCELVLTGEDGVIEFASGFASPLCVVGASVDATEHVEDDGFSGVALGNGGRIVFPNFGHALLPVRPHFSAETLWEEVAGGFPFG